MSALPPVQAAVRSRVGPDQAWAWWTDFREGHEDHGFARWTHPQRRVETLGEGRLRVTDEARVLGLRYREVADLTLDPAQRTLHYDARSTFGRFRGRIAFVPDEAGCRIVARWEQDLRGPLRALGPLGRWAVRRFYAWDLRHHVRDMERDLRYTGSGSPSAP